MSRETESQDNRTCPFETIISSNELPHNTQTLAFCEMCRTIIFYSPERMSDIETEIHSAAFRHTFYCRAKPARILVRAAQINEYRYICFQGRNGGEKYSL